MQLWFVILDPNFLLRQVRILSIYKNSHFYSKKPKNIFEKLERNIFNNFGQNFRKIGLNSKMEFINEFLYRKSCVKPQVVVRWLN